ncbi:hypothetical protein [Rubrolithibacter danxiaensis]|uniref:hypothetical protein n=1 Tax=Rubrolithibacter danxiaensis TaxID=3390805 RepID=UPI003BF7D3C3
MNAKTISKIRTGFITVLCVGNSLAASAQHEHQMPDKSDTTKHHQMMQDSLQKIYHDQIHDRPQDEMNMEHIDHAGMQGMQMNMDVPMNHAYSLNLPMSRNGSGTAWLPDASPMYGIMLHSKKWMYMLHGNIDLRYTKQDLTDKGSRGDEKFDAPNWFMAMAQRKVGKNGLFHWNAMLSLDPLTEGGFGYPLLFQSGESWNGVPLVDRQHPHDLFSELSVSYSHAFSKISDLSFYLGYPGEPAIGPVAFMHRPSALSNPDAPISHHWTDATHITFGVATMGFRYDKFKLEASSFTGREPNENRYNFDKPRFDSWSGRLSFNPSKNWALQISQAYIKSPEELHADENVNRTTASAIYSLPFGSEKWLNATALWGLNKTKGHDGENAALLEADLRLQRFALYTRYEWVQKSVEELSLDESTYGEDTLFPVNAITLGFNYDLFNLGPLRLAGGGQMTLYDADNRLDVLYGKNPLAGEAFLRLYPKLMKMNH